MKKSIIVLGTFDGVHIGHKALFNTAKTIAEEQNLESIVYTFKNHPAELFSDKPIKLLCSPHEKNELILNCGINKIVTDEFDNSIMNMGCVDFAKMLKSRFNMSCAVVGFNYSFGKNAKGNPSLLKELGKDLDFKVLEVPPVYFDGEPVSSTRIRRFLEKGDIITANKQLGHSFSMSGTVIKGRQVGRQIGFPTANILNEYKYPSLPLGVYATRICIDGAYYNSITNIGDNPTFKNNLQITVETHIFDFDCDIYGKTVKVEFLKFIRPQVKFSSVSELIEQINEDKAVVLSIK